MSELKPCPFCGELPEVRSVTPRGNYLYGCSNRRCPETGEFLPEEWNTRPASPALDRLKGEIEKTPHQLACDFYDRTYRAKHGLSAACTCFKSRALRIIEELKHE